MPRVEFREVELERACVPVLRRVDLVVEHGELLAVLGPSGSGKSSLLRLLVGLDAPDRGSVTIDGHPVDHRAPWANGVGMVFQDDALYEHMTVRGNLEFADLVAGYDADTSHMRAERRARRMGVWRLMERRPGTLSGGQRGMVATSRALTDRVRVLALDEPLVRADRQLRIRFRAELRRIHDSHDVTTILATNDQDEAMSIADRLAVLVDGSVRQVDAPQLVRRRPVDTTVAGFVGSPPMNLLPAKMVTVDTVPHIQVGTDTLRWVREVPPSWIGKRMIVGIPPHALRPAAEPDPFDMCLHVTVARVEFLGARWRVHVGLGSAAAPAVVVTTDSDPHRSVGDRWQLVWDSSEVVLFDQSGMAVPL